MNDILDRYRTLLATVDRWFGRCIDAAPSDIACRPGCAGCCRGLFEISLLDARLLQEGFSRLPARIRRDILDKSAARLTALQEQWPDFSPPYILNRLPNEDWQQMPEDDPTPCPLLGEDGLCRVYDDRPMTCRLHGLPNIDLSGESFSDEFCSLNFRDGDPLGRVALRWTFRDVFRREFDLLGEFGRHLTGETCLELDTFIPTALLIDFTTPGLLLPPAAKKRRDA